MVKCQRLIGLRLSLLLVVVAAAGCGEGGDSGSVGPAATQADEQPTQAVEEDAIDLTRLPLGDGKVSTRPVAGSVFACQTRFGGGGAFQDGPWISGDGTWDLTAKAVVDGEVAWPGEFSVRIEGSQRIIEGNGVPSAYSTGIFPVGRNDEAYQYDRNPNSISTRRVLLTLPANPELAADASCVPMGAIGITTSGGSIFNALDAQGRDAVAHEVLDKCDGHPEQTGEYHHHSITPCLERETGGHSELVGYALDGFGIYGHQGVDGVALRNGDLGECHGHSHVVAWDGDNVDIYHYHATWEYPYTVGCLRGS